MDVNSAVHQGFMLYARAKVSNCTVPNDTNCPVERSYYYYRIDIAANAAFLALFALSTLGYIGVYAATRRALAFNVAMLAGTLLEIIGYAGRIMSWKNQWQEAGFLMQIVCLTIAPAFMAAGLYLTVRRIVYAFGVENSRIKPESYTRIFIPCDLVSLLLQAAGGGLASTGSHNSNKSMLDAGNNIMVAGLAFQVFTLAVFMALCLDFAIRTRRRYSKLGEEAFDQNPVFVSLRHNWAFKCFLAALTLATITIFWRSVYRVVELGEGWTGDLIRKQNLFIAFEGVMVIVASITLNIFHPAICFKEGITGLGGLGSSRKAKKQAAEEAKTEGVVDSSGSSTEGAEKGTVVV